MALPEVQKLINNSENKVTIKTPFEMLSGYGPRFQSGALRDLSKTVNDLDTTGRTTGKSETSDERISPKGQRRI